MQNDNLKFKIINAAAVSAIMTVVFITAITISADLYLPLKDWLKNTFFHHWLGKSILAGLIFAAVLALFSFISKQKSEEKIFKNLLILFWISVLGTILIFAFFIYEAL